MYRRTDQKDPDKEEEQSLPDEVVSKQMSSREGQSDGNLESGRHCWIDERNKSIKSAFDTAIKMKYTMVKDIQQQKILSKIHASKVFDKVRSFIK